MKEGLRPSGMTVYRKKVIGLHGNTAGRFVVPFRCLALTAAALVCLWCGTLVVKFACFWSYATAGVTQEGLGLVGGHYVGDSGAIVGEAGRIGGSLGLQREKPSDGAPSDRLPPPVEKSHPAVCEGDNAGGCHICSSSRWAEVAERTARATKGCDVVTYTTVFYTEGHWRLSRDLSEVYSAGQSSEYSSSGQALAYLIPCYVVIASTASADHLMQEEHNGWNVVTVDGTDCTRRLSRVAKLLPHLFFPTARYALFVDYKRYLTVDPRAIIAESLVEHNASFSACWHKRAARRAMYYRQDEWMFRETALIEKRNKTMELQNLLAQIERYYATDVPLWRYAEGALLVTDLQSQFARQLSCSIHREYSLGGDRDQVALAYVLGLTPQVDDPGHVWLAPSETPWCQYSAV